MHKEFLKLLEKTIGVSEHVIAVNLDIRGFTAFCESVQDVDVATYITSVYLKVINDYFKTASFYKPTGDGLIITIPYTRENLEEVASATMDSCLALLKDFADLLVGDHMITYTTPQEIGIGLTRGSACCITSGDKIIDYSGRILNLASRLMDIARPSGIVFDEHFHADLLSEETRKLFAEEMVYVRSVAEETPMKIYYTTKHTLISDVHKQPLKEPRWQTDKREFLCGKWKLLKEETYLMTLSKKPLDESKITVTVAIPHPHLEKDEISGKKLLSAHSFSLDEEEISYKREGNKHYVGIDIQAIKKLLEEDGVTDSIKVRFIVSYPTK